jgi:SAM-dependent methyltransferase
MKRVVERLRQRSRRRRHRAIAEALDLRATSGLILDLGGGAARFFARVHPRPAQVVLVDVNPHVVRRAAEVVPGLRVVVADGCRLPFADRAIRATVCNSVIEHVEDPDRLAHEIERVSASYFVQTPHGRFPLETHSFVPIPFYGWIRSRRLRARLCRIFGADFEYVESVRYLDERQLRRLFPRARLVTERVAGFTKSFYLIAGS